MVAWLSESYTPWIRALVCHGCDMERSYPPAVVTRQAGTVPKLPEAQPLHVNAGERGRKQMMRQGHTFQT
jgi:hypothetical protein